MLPRVTENIAETFRPLERLVLAGFMGSGKSTLGRALARRLGWTFLDLDDEVAGRAGLSVPDIFAQQGEAAFRDAETAVLADLLQRRYVVIALGGGAPETAAVRTLLAAADKTAIVHLYAPFEVVYERCVEQARDPASTHRPLLGERAGAAERYERRLPFYAAVAHHTAQADAGSPEAVADQVLKQVGVQIPSN